MARADAVCTAVIAPIQVTSSPALTLPIGQFICDRAGVPTDTGLVVVLDVPERGGGDA